MKRNERGEDWKEKRESLKSLIIKLVLNRRDLTIAKLCEVVGKPRSSVQGCLTEIRKMGVKIFPSRGPGTPLKIAESMKDCARYINWVRRNELATAHRMVITEHTIGDQYAALSSSPKQLLQILNNVNN